MSGVDNRAAGAAASLAARCPLAAGASRFLVLCGARFRCCTTTTPISICGQCRRLRGLALGLNIVVGFAGLLDLGYAAFFAIGAYAYGILSTSRSAALERVLAAVRVTRPGRAAAREPRAFHGLVLAHAAFLGAPRCRLAARLFGAPTLRLRGDYLAIVTLGFGEIVPIVARNLPSLTNGAAGLNGIAPPRCSATASASRNAILLCRRR